MRPYYEDDAVTLYMGDALDVMTELEVESVDVLLTDPPYFNVKEDDWDRQWKRRDDFLGWLGDALDAATPTLKASASVWVFASPALTSTVELQVITPRFRLLNSIRWVKEAGWHQKAELAAMRSFLTPWEGIIFAEQYSESARSKALDEAKSAWATIGATLRDARHDAGLSREDVAAAFAGAHLNLAGAKARVSAWEIGNERITRHAYDALSNLCRTPWESHTALVAEYERADHLRRAELERTRRPFAIKSRAHSTDVWNFPPVTPYPGKHPCEKPASMLTHMISASSRPGGVDPRPVRRFRLHPRRREEPRAQGNRRRAGRALLRDRRPPPEPGCPRLRYRVMSTASIGRATEYRVRDLFIANGWHHIMRAAASKGSGDLLMGHPLWGGALIQVGRDSKRLGPADRERLCHDAELIGALALLAIAVPRKPLVVWQVDRGKPAYWERWDPDDAIPCPECGTTGACDICRADDLNDIRRDDL